MTRRLACITAAVALFCGQAMAADFAQLEQRLRAGLAFPARAAALLEDLTAWDAVAKRTFDADYLKQLNPAERQRLQRDLAARMQIDLRAFLDGKTVSNVELTKADSGSTLNLRLQRDGTPLDIKLELEDTPDGPRLSDARLGDWRLKDDYRRRFGRRADSDLSYGVLGALLADTPYILLEDFSGNAEGQIPDGWVTWRNKDEKKPKLYNVRRQGERNYVAARDTGLSVILGKPIHWNPRKHPILTWCWRAEVLPTGGDEKSDKLNDSAAGLYVLFSRNWLGVPRQIKYVWSTTLPEDTWYRRPRIFRPYFLVVESGETNLGRWTFEQVDLERDHRRAFDGDAPDKRTLALGMLTDSNSTDSYAEALYADFRAWTRQAHTEGLIEDYCGCYDDAPLKEDSP